VGSRHFEVGGQGARLTTTAISTPERNVLETVEAIHISREKARDIPISGASSEDVGRSLRHVSETEASKTQIQHSWADSVNDRQEC
jgi:hypothetical protein